MITPQVPPTPRHGFRRGGAILSAVVLVVAGSLFVSAQEPPMGIAGRLGGGAPAASPTALLSMDGGRMGRSTMSNGGMMGGMIGESDPNAPYDLQFLDEMIPHHEMAIMMVQMMISQSAHPELRDLGQRIITGQQQQIDQMLAWRQQWYPAAPMNDMRGKGMMGSGMPGGMMGRSMMASDRADRMFLTMMIPHHQRAIAMGNDALTNAQHMEMHGLAQDIITVQSVEITEMQGYLHAWYGITH